MKIKMLVGLSGPVICLSPGDEHEFPDAEARRLVAAGHAVPIVAQKTETAAKKTPAKETR